MSYSHHDSIRIAAAPGAVYDLVSDVTRTGEWSPICVGCEWDDGATGVVGDHFTGHNRTAEREWSTRSRVSVAEPGREFGWIVGDGWVHWRYTVEPDGDGTRLTEWWDFTDAGLAMFDQRYGAEAPGQVENRIRAAHDGIPATLAAIKGVAEAG